ncbi:MAG: VWA domain-containing protein [Hyphomicrobiales bacterium]|nr:VWA domain-containing protein [Hyphomicrobiales bacterium]
MRSIFVRHLYKIASSTALTAVIIASLSVSPVAIAQQGLKKDPATGLIIKVVAGSNKIKALKSPDGAEAFQLELLTPYYVMEEKAGYFRITSVPAASIAEAEAGQTGWVKKDQVFEWPTREALHFSGFTSGGERPTIRAWDEREKIVKFMETGDKTTFAPAFEEDIKSSIGRAKDLRPYPVLESFETSLMGRGEKRIYNVLLPAAIPPTAGIAVDAKSLEQVKDTLESVTFCVIFDATGSMEAIAKNVAQQISDVVDSLSSDTFSQAKMGFVFYRDKDDAGDKSLIVPPLPIREASNKLQSYSAKMTGGGDAAEPVLDAIALGVDFFDWSAGDAQSGARKVAIIVLNDDAKPTTEGLIDPRVEAGLTADDIGKKLANENVVTITVQAGPKAGPKLKEVLEGVSLAAGGAFIEWKDGGVKDQIGAAIKSSIAKVASGAKEDAKEVLDEAVIRGEKAVISLKVLDGEKLDRLRRAGVKFNIEDGKGGVLVEPGYLPENEELLEPQIKVEKETVQRLITLFSVMSVTTANAADFRKTVEENIAAMAGEKPDPKENISTTVKKRLGIQFRTKMLDINPEALEGLTSSEKLAFQKRIKEAADNLGDFNESRLAEFDSAGSIWMPVGILP